MILAAILDAILNIPLEASFFRVNILNVLGLLSDYKKSWFCLVLGMHGDPLLDPRLLPVNECK